MKFRDVKGESMSNLYDALIKRRDTAKARAYSWPEGSEQRNYMMGVADGIDDIITYMKIRWGDR